MNLPAGLYGAAVAAIAIIAATVAVCLHAIDGGTYGGIVGAGLGGALGAGAHASGVKQGRS